MGNIVLRKNRVTANTLIGKVGELTINTTDKTLYIHDGSTTGGFSLFRYNTSSAIGTGEVPFANGTQGVLASSTNLKWTSPNLLISNNKVFHAGNFVQGTGVSITESPTNTFTIANTGVTSITAGTGISITASTGAVTISNSGGGSGGGTTLEGLSGSLTFVDGDITFAPSGLTQITATISSTPASTLTGTIPSGVLGNSTHYIGTTAVALNRSSANQALTGISSVTFPGSTSGTVLLQAAAIAGTSTITLPAVSSPATIITSADSGSVTNTMLAGSIAYSKLSLSNSIVNADIATGAGIVYSKLSLSNSIVNADIATGAAIAVSKLAASTISGITLGNNLATLTFGSYLTGTSYNGSTSATIAVDATNLNTASKIVARDASGNFSAGTITATSFSGSGASLTSIPNSALVNSSITVNGTSISLGSSGTVSANTTNSLTFDNSGTGEVSGTTFNGSAARTISYNTIGAPSTTGTNASGSWGISVTGSSASCTGNALTATTLQTSRTFSITGPVTASGISFNGSGDVQLNSVINTTTLSVNTTSERVGIGTQTPSTKLEVVGNTLLTGNLTVTGTLSATISGYVDTSTTQTINGVKTFTSTISGNISGTSYNITQYTINQNVGTGNSPSFAGLTVDTNTLYVDATNDRVGVGLTNPTYKLHVSGAIYATGDVYAGSDIRMKENLIILTNALDKVKNLQGYSYNKIGIDHRSIGLIAQEVETIIPEVVSRNTEGMKGIDYGQITALLVEAIKELNDKLENIYGTSI